MDSIEFQEQVSHNPKKLCRVELKNGEVHTGINEGVLHDGFGTLLLCLRGKGDNIDIPHTDISNIYFYDELNNRL